MAVYVDQLIRWPTNLRTFANGSCHLIAETEEELHTFAARLGLRRKWFQPKSFPHYDLTGPRRVAALAAGAVELSSREFVMTIRRIREEAKP
jgi:hypothetical protein